MTLDEQQLRDQLREAQRQADGEVPTFVATWAAAEARRNRWPVAAAIAASAIVAVIAVTLQSPTPEPADEMLDLLGAEEFVVSTTWVAPSDALLPEHRFDIFQEMPELFQSTGTEEGTLL